MKYIFKKTKIIATIGPSTDHPQLVSRLIRNGMNVARINMAHANNNDKIKDIVHSIRNESEKLGQNIGISQYVRTY